MANNPHPKNAFVLFWEVKHFSSLWNYKKQMCSPDFPEDTFNKCHWYLQLCPGNDACKPHMSCYLVRKAAPSLPDITVDFTIFVLDSNDQPVFSRTENNANYSLAMPIHGFDRFMKRSEIRSRKDEFLPKNSLRLKCEIRRETPCFSISSYMEFHSDSFQFDIPHFSLLPIGTEKRFLLCFKNGQAPTLYLKMSILGDYIDEASIVLSIMKACKSTSYYFGVAFPVDPPVLIQTETYVMHGQTSDATRFYIESSHIFNSHLKEETAKNPLIIQRSDLLREKDAVLPDDLLTICCKIRINLNDELSSGPPEERQTALCEDPKQLEPFCLGYALLNDEELSDLTIKIGPETFQVHKCVLSCRSPTFSAMIADRAGEESTVEITDMESETMKHLLYYIYTNKLNIKDHKSLCKLYLAADKWQMKELQKQCATKLMSTICFSNVWEICALACSCDGLELKEAAKSYIISHIDTVFNYCDKVMKKAAQILFEVKEPTPTD